MSEKSAKPHEFISVVNLIKPNYGNSSLDRESAKRLIEAICLYYELPFHKVDPRQLMNALCDESLIRLLAESKVEKIRHKIYDLRYIHPFTLSCIRLAAAAEIQKCPPAEDLRPSVVIIRNLFQKFQSR